MSARRQHFIYIPGLGDGYDGARQLFIAPWKLHPNVTTELVSMHWLDERETFAQKQGRIAMAIDRTPQDADVFLVGESAGGSMAISMLGVRADRITQVVTVCGLNLNVHNVSPRLLRKNRAFGDAVRDSEEVIRHLNKDVKNKIHTIYSRLDPVVTKNNTLVAGTRSTIVGFPGHMWSIVLIALLRFGSIRSYESYRS